MERRGMNELNNRLPGTEVMQGALYDFPSREVQEGEVLTELETRSIWANEHHKGVEQSLGSALEHAIEAGKHLAAARDSFSDRQVRDGEFGKWLSNNFQGSKSTAYRYMRFYRNRDVLGVQGSGRLSLESAEKLLASPKDNEAKEDAKQPPVIDQDEVEEPQQESNEVVLPTGEVVSIAEAASFYAKQAEELKKAKEAAQKAKDAEKKAKINAKKARHEAKKAQEEQQATVNAEFREAVKSSFEEQLLELHARHGIEDTPTIFEVDAEEWKEALSQTRDNREKEILNVISEFFPFVSKIRQYEPDEAARAALKWPSEARAKEAIEEIAEFFSAMQGEMEALTTPGVLRAVKGDN